MAYNSRPNYLLALGGATMVVLLFGSIFFMAAATVESVPPDKIMLHYSGGPIEGTKFQEIIPPGTPNRFYGLLEKTYKLPTTVRTYTFSKDDGQGDRPGFDFILAPSQDNVPFQFESTTYFKLNPNHDVMRKFFEAICLKTHCWTDGGWTKMLDDYFRPQVELALRSQVGLFKSNDLYSNPNTLAALNTTVGAGLKEAINGSLGGEYFCGPNSTPDDCQDFGLVVKNPTPPQSQIDAFVASGAAAQNIITAQNNATAKMEQAKGDAAAAAQLASAPPVPQAQVDLMRAQAMQACAANPNCTLVITEGPGANINVGAGG